MDPEYLEHVQKLKDRIVALDELRATLERGPQARRIAIAITQMELALGQLYILANGDD